ncbi:hypothetical protein D3C86_1848160 [compost metagenome]
MQGVIHGQAGDQQPAFGTRQAERHGDQRLRRIAGTRQRGAQPGGAPAAHVVQPGPALWVGEKLLEPEAGSGQAQLVAAHLQVRVDDGNQA